MTLSNIEYLVVDLFCTLEEIQRAGGIRGRGAGILYGSNTNINITFYQR